MFHVVQGFYESLVLYDVVTCYMMSYCSVLIMFYQVVPCCFMLFSGCFHVVSPIWVFPKIEENPPKWMVKIMENPIKMG